LDSPISVKFDSNVASLDTTTLFDINCGDTPITGITVYDANTKTATFVASGVLPAGSKISVTVVSNALSNQTQKMWMDYNFTFNTASSSIVNIFIKRKNKTTKVNYISTGTNLCN
jgi:hypothetical protein